MEKKHVTISVPAKQYEDHDDCLAAAAADYVSYHPEAKGCDMDPRWENEDEREVILLDVPRVSREWKPGVTGWVACDYTGGDCIVDVAHSDVYEDFAQASSHDKYEGVRYVDKDGYLYVENPMDPSV